MPSGCCDPSLLYMITASSAMTFAMTVAAYEGTTMATSNTDNAILLTSIPSFACKRFHRSGHTQAPAAVSNNKQNRLENQYQIWRFAAIRLTLSACAAFAQACHEQCELR